MVQARTRQCRQLNRKAHTTPSRTNQRPASYPRPSGMRRRPQGSQAPLNYTGPTAWCRTQKRASVREQAHQPLYTPKGEFCQRPGPGIVTGSQPSRGTGNVASAQPHGTDGKGQT